MRRLLFVSCIAAALACGSVNDKQGCSVSTDCPVGQFCATGGGESHCFADTQKPTVSGVSATCATSPCLRDGVVHVEATVSDDNEVLDAAVSLDVDPSHAFPMTRSGAVWVADVPLRAVPFEAFARNVVPTIVARDGARNSSDPAAAASVAVTRLRWQVAVDTVVGLSVTPPAVMSDGTTVIGGSNGKVYFIAADGTNAHVPLVVGTGQITAAPAIGQSAIWIGSEDGHLYAVELDRSAVIPNVGGNLGGGVRGSLGVRVDPGKEWAFGVSAAAFAGASSNVASEFVAAGPASAFAAGPVVGLDGRAYAATSTGSLRAYRLTTTPAITLSESWSATLGGSVSAPLAVDGDGSVWGGTLASTLIKTVPAEASGTPNQIATLPSAVVDSPIILANGDIVVGDQTGVVHRYSASGAKVWSTEPNVGTGAAVGAPLVLTGASAELLVPTAGGKLFALRDDGSEVWSTTLEAGKAIRPPNIYTAPGQAGSPLSTAYLANESGKVFAVIVDGQLDASAPWPKAFHDPKNTNHAGPQP